MMASPAYQMLTATIDALVAAGRIAAGPPPVRRDLRLVGRARAGHAACSTAR